MAGIYSQVRSRYTSPPTRGANEINRPVISLASGLFFLARDDSNSPRLLKALKIRVGLSITLIVFLVGAYSLGYIQ